MKTAKLVLGLFAALAMPSCFQNETTITLNKNGSGTIVEETLLGAQFMAMLAQFAHPGQPDPVVEMFKEEKAKEKTVALGEGVEYVKTEMFEKDGRKGARVHYPSAALVERVMKVPMVSVAQICMLSEGLAEPHPPCELPPDDLAPAIAFTDTQIRKGLPKPKPFGLADLV